MKSELGCPTLLLSELLVLSFSCHPPWPETCQKTHSLRGTPCLPNNLAPFILLLPACASSSPWMSVAVFALLCMSSMLWLWYQLRFKGLGSAHQMGMTGKRTRQILCQQMKGRVDTVNAYVEIISSQDADSTLQILARLIFPAGVFRVFTSKTRLN